MAVPTSKAELLVAMTTTFDRLMADLARVPEQRTRENTLVGHRSGTTMSPADLVAYLVGWNELVLKWLEQDDQGATVDFPRDRFQLERAWSASPEVLRGPSIPQLSAAA